MELQYVNLLLTYYLACSLHVGGWVGGREGVIDHVERHAVKRDSEVGGEVFVV